MPITYDRKAFFDAIRTPLFKGAMTASQVQGMSAILDAWERLQPAGDTRFIAYMLATAWWETAKTMQPIEEYGHGKGRAYGVPAGPWHQVYDGRGDVQLTWLANYQHATTKLRAIGMLTTAEDLAQTPALAMRPDVAAAIMINGMLEGWFTGKKLADYLNGTTTDYVGARRIINGTDQAATIAAAAQIFFTALHGAIVLAAVKPPAPALTVTPVSTPAPAAPSGVLARLANYFGRH